MISWEDYNKLILEKDVKVYDYHKRISYYRLNQLNSEQKGGGVNINHNIKKILENKNKINTELFSSIVKLLLQFKIF
jgi:hypothetical protein